MRRRIIHFFIAAATVAGLAVPDSAPGAKLAEPGIAPAEPAPVAWVPPAAILDVPVAAGPAGLRAEPPGCSLLFDANDARVSVAARSASSPEALVALRALGSWSSPTHSPGLVSYSNASMRSALVYRPIPNGVKEDLVLFDEAAFGSGLFTWTLELADGLDARLQADGSIDVCEGPRRRARIPAPVAHDAAGRPVAAAFRLALPFLGVSVARPASYPLVVDPTIVLSDDATFASQANDEGLVRFATDQVHRDAVLGAHVPSWTSAGTLVTARYTHGSAVSNRFLYVVGGHTGGSSLPNVEFAALNEDGTTGPFASTTALPAGRHLLGVAAYNGYLYATGGTDATAPNTSVFYAKLNSNGTISPGAWQTGPAIPGGGRRDHASVAHNGFLFIIGGTTPGGTTAGVLSAAIRADGSLGAWTTVSTMTSFRAMLGAFAHDGFLYAVGGNNGSFDIATSEFARVNPDGTLSPWTATSSLPSARQALRVTAAGGYAFSVGGNGSNQTSVVSAPVLPGGGLGPWQTTTSLAIGREHPGCVTYNDRVFVTGGWAGSVTPTVVSALPEAGHVGPWAISGTMPGTRVQISTAVYNGYLYVPGGHNGTSATNTVLYAPINADGTLGAFNTTTPFSGARFDTETFAHNGRLYILGGWNSAYFNDVQFAPINADGTLGAWQTTASFATPRHQHRAWTYRGKAYISGGSIAPSNNVGDIQSATINTDGTLSPWSAIGSLPSARRIHQMTVWGDRLYCSGGIGPSDSTYNGQVDVTTFDAAGGIGPWTLAGTLPTPRFAHYAVASDGRFYVLNGTGAASYVDAWVADINAGGLLGSFASTTAPPAIRHWGGVSQHNGFILLIGGYSATGNHNDVISARLSPRGTLGSWTTAANYAPNQRYSHAGAAVNGFLYNAGGGNPGQTYSEVRYAPVNADGSIGGWIVNPNSFPTPRIYHEMVAHNGWLYSLGTGNSFSDGTPNPSIVRAALNTDGSTGPWSATTAPLPAAVTSLRAAVWNGRVYIAGGSTGAAATAAVRSAVLQANGDITSWTSETSLPAPRQSGAMVAWNDRLYFIGGFNAGYQHTVFTAPIGGGGAVGAWTPTASLPYIAAQRAAVHQGWIYVAGNETGSAQTAVVAAPVLSDGSLGAWQFVTNLPFSISANDAILAHRGGLYVFSGGTPQACFTALRAPAPRAIYSKLIDLGSDQNVTSVTTTFSGSPGTVSLTVRSATTASPAFAALSSGTLASGTPFPCVATARYLHLRYILDDSNNVTVSPDVTAHLTIDSITVATTSPPLAPTNLAQFQDDDFTPIPLGAGADTTTIFIHADVDDPDFDDVRLHVELKPVGIAFTNTPTASTAFITSPNSVALQITGLTPGTQYHWQAWVEDFGGAGSAPVPFGGNPDPSGVDLFVDQAPTAPTAMGQFESDGVTPIVDGGSTLSSTVVLKGTRADPDSLSLVLVELEIQPAGTPFTDTATNTSVFAAPGVQASFTLSGLVAGGYHWQMRCIDDNGKVSTPWTPFSGSATHFTVVTNQPPNAPANLLQFENDGTTPILFGNAAAAANVKFQADLTDPNGGDSLKIQVELRPTGVAFTSPGTPAIDNVVFFETPLLAQGTQQIPLTIPTDGTWHWQARTVDPSGAASPWTTAGGNPEPDGVDLSLDLINDPPTINPATVDQFQSDGTTVIALGGNATTLGVVFKAEVVDPEGGTVTLEIELRDTATPFTPAATHTAGPFASGSTISVTATPAIGSYHWAYRATDGVTVSAWTSFGGNPEANADFNTAANGVPTVATLAQFLADGTTPLPIGDSTTGTSVVLQAVVTDPEAQTVRLRVEVKPVGVAFDGATNLTDSALFPSGSTIQVTVPGLADGAWHWQAIGVDVLGAAGTGVSFGGNPEADPDFRVDAANDAPSTPFGVGQYSPPGTTGLALGGNPFGRTVVLKASASDDELGQIAFEVEVQPVGTAFTGTRTHPTQLSFGPAGVPHTITLDDLPAGSYHWQIRAVDAQVQASAWVSYGGNSEGAADFVITATIAVPPNAPLNLKQRLVNDLVDIAPGTTIAQAAVRLKAQVVHPRTEIVKLQVEVRPMATGFTGTVTTESDFVDSGSTAEVVVSGMPNDSYLWRARTVDSKGTSSAWTAYGSAPDFVVDVAVNTAPDAPALFLQFQANATTQLAVGASTTQASVVYGAIALDADGDPVRLEVELKPTGAAFDGTVSGSTSFFPSGTTLYVRIGSLPDGRYHAQARMTDANGSSSAWVSYGGNPETDADFIVNATANTAPALAAALQQLRDGGTTSIDIGALAGAGDLTFRSDASDTDTTDLLRLEVEVRPVGEALTSTPTHSGDFVPQGYVADAVVGRFTFDQPCHWQARVVDVNGADSGWLEFGGNPAGDTDFVPSSSIAGGGGKNRTCGLIGLEVLLLALLMARARRARAQARRE